MGAAFPTVDVVALRHPKNPTNFRGFQQLALDRIGEWISD